MEVFRISEKKYSTKLTSSGSANRWNLAGQHVLYCGSSRSLSSLELVVHKASIQPKKDYAVMVISIADDDELTRQIHLKDLPADWRRVSAYAQLQKIGAYWFRNQETLVLKVPSAIIPYEYNYVINTEHPQFSKQVKLVRTEKYFWDDRLVGS